MRVVFAFIGVILLWATTPLAIKWSGEGPGFLFGATGRMVIGAVCIVVVQCLYGRGLVWNKPACHTYLAVAMQIYGAMLAVYWAAQYIPSGWISVIFGLTPLVTAILAAVWLKERSLTPVKLVAYVCGVSGLAVMFGSAAEVGDNSVKGIAGVMLAVLLQSASAVWVQRIDARLPAVSQVAGGLLFAVPAYLLTWGVADGHWPCCLSQTSLASIVYLGVVATTVGFALYYYVLTHLPATRVALITLVSPVLALFLGHTANHEPVTTKVAVGTVLILAALLLHAFSGRRNRTHVLTDK